MTEYIVILGACGYHEKSGKDTSKCGIVQPNRLTWEGPLEKVSTVREPCYSCFAEEGSDKKDYYMPKGDK